MPDEITAAERELIDRHIERNGVTECRRGEMATVPEYYWQPRKGCGGQLRPKEKQDWMASNGTHMRNRARAARLRQAEKAEQ